MYFLNDEEKKQLVKNYLPRSRQMDIAEELRGWNWHQPPLAPVYDLRLALYEVANSYCPTARDLYLKRIDGIKARPNPAMVRGRVLHDVLAQVLVRAKKAIYNNNLENVGQLIREVGDLPALDQVKPSHISDEDWSDIRKKAELIAQFEAGRIQSRLQDVLVKQPNIGVDSLVSLALPVVVEQRLDGSFLGLSPNLSSDAFTFSEPMILDLKFGEPQKFHRLTTTGYALVMEALHEYPVNLGCLVYVDFRGDRMTIRKDIHIIDDELRQWFIEERDNKMRMLYEEIDPGVDNCYPNCPYTLNCRG
ncbi:MAG: type I-A CRISPR-associated protein Cas4/Csa1 [Peptococcaceae bacterium]|nr:type I-A CRISPR-associated protein Cas4/Csa1 [Peptococcaceae bacterium]